MGGLAGGLFGRSALACAAANRTQKPANASSPMGECQATTTTPAIEEDKAEDVHQHVKKARKRSSKRGQGPQANEPKHRTKKRKEEETSNLCDCV
jgi:hypothetical protein